MSLGKTKQIDLKHEKILQTDVMIILLVNMNAAGHVLENVFEEAQFPNRFHSNKVDVPV